MRRRAWSNGQPLKSPGRPGLFRALEPQIRGVIKLDGGLALIYDLEKFLSLEEAVVLEAAMSKGAALEI